MAESKLGGEDGWSYPVWTLCRLNNSDLEGNWGSNSGDSESWDPVGGEKMGKRLGSW